MKTLHLTITLTFIFLLSLNFISGVSITDVSSSPQEVVPGEIVNIVIEVENIFEYDVKNLNVKLDLAGEDVPFAPYQSSSEKFLDELDDGDEEDFKFKLIVLPETASGIYKIPVEISYEDDDEESCTKDELISVTVNSKPELKVSLVDSEVLIKGKENVFSIKIINSGLADVKFVYLSITDSGGIKIISEKEQYIGDIDSDDFDSVEYLAYINADASGIINLPVILKFKDATNKEFTESKNLILKTYSLKDAQNLGLVKKPSYTIYIVIGILVFGYVGYRWRKKRKLKRGRSWRWKE